MTYPVAFMVVCLRLLADPWLGWPRLGPALCRLGRGARRAIGR
jgi:hypothetical protein